MKLNGRNAIISGSNQGFGYAVAKAFVQEGANVMLCARNIELLNKICDELNHLTQGKSKVVAMHADISKPADVKKLVKATLDTFGGIDILVANAGVYGPKGPIEEIDWEEWSTAIDINLKGVVLQCREVLPHFKKKKSGKILLLSGGGATKPMPYLSAYAASKAAVVRFGETLAQEVSAFNIDVNSIAPGALNTRLLDELLEAGPEKVGDAFYQQSLKQQQQGGTPLEVGASLCVYLGSKDSDGITGKLISAVWDPWQKFHDHKQDLQSTDIYTLRRIVPEDREKAWGEVK